MKKYNLSGLKDKLKIVAVTGLAALTFNCGDINEGLAPKYKQQNKPIVTEITDHDWDGIPTDIEIIYGLDPYDADTDDDGLLDSTEGLSYFSKNLRNLSSGNQSTNDYLNGLGTNPLDSDTDDDGLIDGLEVGLERPEDKYSTRTLSSFDEDPSTTTNPLSFDTDGDGLWDGEEDNNYNGMQDSNETEPSNIDSDGNGYTDVYNLIVHPLNNTDHTSPLAEYTATPINGLTLLDVNFNSSGSFDPESGIDEYYWDFDNDMIIDSQDQNPIFTFSMPGVYNPTLIVTNGSGLYASNRSANIIVGNGDLDNDGYYALTNPLDCNDNDNSINPGSTEVCDNIDNNCDGLIDEGVQNNYYRDNDNDGYGNSLESILACSATPGYVSNNLDCDDSNANISPSVIEIDYNGIDDDCNSSTLDDDLDQDGFYTLTGIIDCNDNNPVVNPGATEILSNGIDDDCNPATLDIIEKIAFASDRDGNYEIYVMNSDGSNQTRLTNNSALDTYLSWSPDGSKIVFTSDRDGNYEIYVMNSDGSNQTRLTNNSSWDGYPAWSPDGTKIAFASNITGSSNIYTMNTDGTGKTRITNGPGDSDEPDWSPDGTKIAFEKCVMCKIMTINPDGTNEINISNYPGAHNSYPAWSPDGTKIAFYANRVAGVGYQLYLMNSDGSNQTRVFNDPTFSGDPDWSPDGSKIIFTSNMDGDTEIYTINPDGSNLTKLTINNAQDSNPKWTIVY